MQRWALILEAYQYDMQYRSSEQHRNCDSLSRLSLHEIEQEETEEGIFTLDMCLTISSQEIAIATRRDPIMSRMFDFTLNGWPAHVEDAGLQPFFDRRNELTLEKGLIWWGMRVIIPEMFRGRLLLELHEEHLGMSRTKALARGYLWWPYLDRDIEDMVERSSACAYTRNTPKESPLHSWIWASRPGQRVHIDYAEYEGHFFLVIVDSFSKWLEVIPVKSTTSRNTI
ncbi:uncharacterized protein K02A2.6-like [Saccostrea echinata]|uniref:uncharacterized protein K02A2.6-like n=1 Tax=Saccostrea echinata TaxID=191078 RepID=UPI002A7F7CEC|nr:uncharacterized protein K02A2.6-like [Saccostrea echinata]